MAYMQPAMPMVDDAKERFENLSVGQRNVVQLFALGYRLSDIGVELGIARNTADHYLRDAKKKLNVDHNGEVAMEVFMGMGVIKPFEM